MLIGNPQPVAVSRDGGAASLLLSPTLGKLASQPPQSDRDTTTTVQGQPLACSVGSVSEPHKADSSQGTQRPTASIHHAPLSASPSLPSTSQAAGHPPRPVSPAAHQGPLPPPTTMHHPLYYQASLPHHTKQVIHCLQLVMWNTWRWWMICSLCCGTPQLHEPPSC